MPEVNVGLMKVHQTRVQCGFVVVDVKQDGKDVRIVLTAQGKGKLASAKLGKMPLPLKLQVKEGTTFKFVLSEA